MLIQNTKNSTDLSGNIVVSGNTYEYNGVLLWNDADSTGDNNPVDDEEEDKNC